MTRDHLTIRPIDVAPVPRLSLREPEAAEALGVSPSWLRREAGAGRIPSVLIAGVRLYPVATLAAFLAEQVERQAAKGNFTAPINRPEEPGSYGSRPV